MPPSRASAPTRRRLRGRSRSGVTCRGRARRRAASPRLPRRAPRAGEPRRGRSRPGTAPRRRRPRRASKLSAAATRPARCHGSDRLPERPRVVERTSSRRRCFLGQRPDLEHAHASKPRLRRAACAGSFCSITSSGHRPRRLGEHRLHQRAADARRPRLADTTPTPPIQAASPRTARNARPTGSPSSQRDARAGEIDVPRVDHVTAASPRRPAAARSSPRSPR